MRASFPVRAGRPLQVKLIPRNVHSLPELNITDVEWESLALPINLAFFFQSSPGNKMKAMYPSPAAAGATESLLPLKAWDSLVASNITLARMEPDVEALLVNRVGTKREYYLAPIDVCFELVGLIRVHWRGRRGERLGRNRSIFFPSSNGIESCVSCRWSQAMPDLNFRVTGVEPAARGLVPLIHFHLEVTNFPETELIQAVMLQAQIQIQSALRPYADEEKEKLGDLFGTPDRWGQTLRNRLWAHAYTTVRPFERETEAVLPTQCTYDLNVTATKYF